MKLRFILVLFLGISGAFLPAQKGRAENRTSFQVSEAWNPRTDVQCDIAMVYGVNETLGERIRSWAENGYRVELMTGVAWGGYRDYTEGRFDGQKHEDTCQTDRNGRQILHGGAPGHFYFVPVQSYRDYLFTLLQKAIDQGIDAIYLEEPEFWARAGYSEAFKREWKAAYGTDWEAPHSSVDARAKTANLMQKLYRDTLIQLFTKSKEYARGKGREVRCFVPTHSLINYAQWGIVTPMATLMRSPAVDGYIAQVWTGTSRTPNNYMGERRERTFETAYLEFAQMIGMVKPTGRTCWLLADPIEDNQNLGWDDYEKNYQCVVTASLLHPDEAHYEVMPWPQRIFITPHYRTNAEAARRDDPNPPPRVPIPEGFATSLMASVSALNEMERGGAVEWDCGTQRLGVLVSDTMMFQRDDPGRSDRALGSFFGLAMPLVKHGMPVKVIPIETLTSGTAALRDVDALLMTYEGMKPYSPDYNEVLARWVREDGGGLIYVDDGKDPHNAIRQWWNQGGMTYDHPGQHLLEKLGLRQAGPGLSEIGKGWFYWVNESPAALTYRKDGGTALRGWVKETLNSLGKGAAWRECNYLVLRRGRFVVASALNESVDGAPVTLNGKLVNLYDGGLPVVSNPALKPGEQALYVDLAKCAAPCVVASASRVRGVEAKGNGIKFVSRGPIGVTCRTRLLLAGKPNAVKASVGGKALEVKMDWDEATKTALLAWPNQAAEVAVECGW